MCDRAAPWGGALLCVVCRCGVVQRVWCRRKGGEFGRAPKRGMSESAWSRELQASAEGVGVGAGNFGIRRSVKARVGVEAGNYR